MLSSPGRPPGAALPMGFRAPASTMTTATATNAKTTASPILPLVEDTGILLLGEDSKSRTRFLPQSRACASILLYLSAFQLHGSVVEASGTNSARRAHPRGMRSETVHRSQASPLRTRGGGAPPGSPPAGLHRPPSGRGARPLPGGPPRRGGARARRRRQLLEARACPADPPSSVAGAPVPPRREPRELRKAVSPLERGGVRGGPVDPRTSRSGGGDPLEVRMGAAIPRVESGAARRVRGRNVARRRPCRTVGVHLKSGGRRFGIPSLIS